MYRKLSKSLTAVAVLIMLSGCGGGKSTKNPSSPDTPPQDNFTRSSIPPQYGASPAHFAYIAIYQQGVFGRIGIEPAVAVQMATEETNRIHRYSGTNIQYTLLDVLPDPDNLIRKTSRLETTLYETRTEPGSYTRERLDAYGADFVMVLRDGGDPTGTVGITWIGPELDRSYRNFVIDATYMNGVTVAHELGHLLGLRHNTSEAPDTYAVGYANEDGQFNTVMHYGKPGYLQEWVFSSPNLLCGKAEKSYPCGISAGAPEQADAVKALIENKAFYGK